MRTNSKSNVSELLSTNDKYIENFFLPDEPCTINRLLTIGMGFGPGILLISRPYLE